MITLINVKNPLEKKIYRHNKKKNQNEISSMLWRVPGRNLDPASHLLLRNVKLCGQNQKKSKMTLLLFSASQEQQYYIAIPSDKAPHVRGKAC